jgi:hypothetical protein
LVWRWFTPHQGRLFYFLMAILVPTVIGGNYLSQSSAQAERASPAPTAPEPAAAAAPQAERTETPAEKALQEIAPVEPSPLAPSN